MTKKKTYIIHVCNVQHGKAVYDKLIKLGALAKFKLTDMPFPGIFFVKPGYDNPDIPIVEYSNHRSTMHDAFLKVKNRYTDNYVLMSATEFLLDLQLIPLFDAYIIIDGKAYHKDYIKEALKLKESKSNNGIYFDKVIIRGNPINNTK